MRHRSLGQIKNRRVLSRLVCVAISLDLQKLAPLKIFQSEGRNYAGWSFKLLLSALALLGSVINASADDACWINAKTGKPYPPSRLVPVGTSIHEFQADPNHVYIPPGPGIPGGGNLAGNWVRVGGTWTNAKTGEPYPPSRLVPVGTSIHEFQADPNHVYIPPGPDIPGGGNLAGNWVRVPCPPQTASSTGLYLGGELVKNWGRVRATETSAATGAVTNQFTDSGDPLGGGIVAGWNFTPWNNNWVIGPYASFDWLRLTINHTFPTGFYLGTTTNWIANLGGKAGYMVAPDWQVYGLAGAAWLNESLNINFPAGFSTKTTTTPGFTLGFGTEYYPASWAVAGHPISLFAQYQHTWYADANFNTPTPASPAFNYAFRRDDDMVKIGAVVHQ